MNITLSDGRTVYAYTGGKPFDAQLPCVVLLHGALNDHSVWTLLARWMAHHGHSVLALDQPGHMRSSGPVMHSVEALGAWTLEVLDAVGVERATVVGHSMGSLIALEAAAQAPERITRLVMVGSAYPMAVSDALLDAALHRPMDGIRLVSQLSLSQWAAKPSYPGPGAWLHGGSRALMQRVLQSHPADNLFVHDFSLCNRYRAAEQAMPRVQAECHLVVGSQDVMTPAKATAVLVKGLNAQVHTLPCGHALMQEAPDGLLRIWRSITEGRPG